MEHAEGIMFGLAAILCLGVGAQWVAWRLRLPSILLLLGAGFLVGPGLGFLEPDALFGELLFPLVSFSVALILFEGALGLRLAELRTAGRAILNLVTVGAAVTWLLGTVGARVFLGFSTGDALLLGAILVVTGPTVIGPILRHVRPIGRVGAISKWEGIVIDPIGAILAVLIFDAIHVDGATEVSAATGQILANLARTMGGSLATATISAAVLVLFLRRYWIPDFLQSPVLLMVVVLTFVGSNLLQVESGLVAVTLLGVILANQRTVTVEHLVEFKENLRVLLISSLFILLAARVQPSEFAALGWGTVAFVALLILVVRPAAVFLATLGCGLRWQERVFLSWLAPRGIVSAAFASVFALRFGGLHDQLVPVTFVVIVATVVVYSLTITPLAQWLALATPNPQGVLIAGANPLARQLGKALHEEGYRVLVVDRNRSMINAARMEGLPTWFGSILSKQALDELDLGGIGRFLALMPNDEVNSLAAWHFSEIFGRGEVFQLAPSSPRGPRAETALEHLRGRFLFASKATYAFLQSRLAEGAVVKRTPLTEEFDIEAFRALYGPKAVPLFLIGEGDKLTVQTADNETSPKPGQTLISLVKEVSKEENRVE